MTRQEDIWVNIGKRSCHAVRPGTVGPLESRRCLNKIVFRLSKHYAPYVQRSLARVRRIEFRCHIQSGSVLLLITLTLYLQLHCRKIQKTLRIKKRLIINLPLASSLQSYLYKIFYVISTKMLTTILHFIFSTMLKFLFLYFLRKKGSLKIIQSMGKRP